MLTLRNKDEEHQKNKCRRTTTSQCKDKLVYRSSHLNIKKVVTLGPSKTPTEPFYERRLRSDHDSLDIGFGIFFHGQIDQQKDKAANRGSLPELNIFILFNI